ncbi:MAG TPA: sigma-70 family RNA polymerase sigma factor, partial [Steroidobacteraceae bacterium]|nr:sigma-70 family RNA polymerase sigma factor [Steroidobacteraceae bacterium]
PAGPQQVLPAVPLLAELRAAQRGDQAAFACLVRAHQARVFSVALRLTGRREDAEELAQDAFVQLHAALSQINSPAHLLHWLLRTISHRSIDRLRQRERSPRLVQIEVEHAAEENAVDPLWSRRLHALLSELPVAPRAVLLLRYQEDLEPGEIAAALDMPLNTVKSHLRRSLEWLRAQQVAAGENHGH